MSASPAPAEGRGAFVISQVYYYVAAVVGVAFGIGGLIAFFFGIRTLAFPSEFEGTRDGLRGMLLGLSFAVPGLLTTWWNVREARRREGWVPTGAFWGSALYFHLVSLVGLGFVIGGTAMILALLSEGLVPECNFVEFAQSEDLVLSSPRDCTNDWGETGRDMLNAAIFVLVGGSVMWWHLRQGRRLTAPPREAVP